MTSTQFENGYWYVSDLKTFAKVINIPAANKLRKDELEKAIVSFLHTGKIKSPTKRSLSQTGARDIEIGLSLELPVVNYTSNKKTKDFILKEAHKIDPNLKKKPGARYRLNRWREEQLTKGMKITYGDLVTQYVKLNQLEKPFDRIPHGRYINFISDFLSSEKGATKQQAIKAWKQLKTLDIPKTYDSWLNFHSSIKK